MPKAKVWSTAQQNGTAPVFLPLTVDDKPVLVAVAANRWLADQTAFGSGLQGVEGVQFRGSKRLQSKIPGVVLRWGEQIDGTDTGDGWVSCFLSGMAPRRESSAATSPAQIMVTVTDGDDVTGQHEVMFVDNLGRDSTGKERLKTVSAAPPNQDKTEDGSSMAVEHLLPRAKLAKALDLEAKNAVLRQEIACLRDKRDAILRRAQDLEDGFAIDFQPVLA